MEVLMNGQGEEKQASRCCACESRVSPSVEVRLARYCKLGLVQQGSLDSNLKCRKGRIGMYDVKARGSDVNHVIPQEPRPIGGYIVRYLSARQVHSRHLAFINRSSSSYSSFYDPLLISSPPSTDKYRRRT